MEFRPERRKFIKDAGRAALAGAITGFLKLSEAEAQPALTYSESSLSSEKLRADKERAQAALNKNIPSDKQLDHIRSFVHDLIDESQMDAPKSAEVERVSKQIEKAADFEKFIRAVEGGGTGIVSFSETWPDDKELVQKLYVVKKHANGNIEFVKSYLTAAGDMGFGNDTGQTPMGYRPVTDGEIGILGQVLSKTNINLSQLFIHVGNKYFAKGFGKETLINNATEVVTDKYTIDATRGIYIHGTNRTGDRDDHGVWKTLLGGMRRTSACLRLANADIRDLFLSGFIWKPGTKNEKGSVRKIGTPVLVHATPEALKYLSDPRYQNTGRPGGRRVGDYK